MIRYTQQRATLAQFIWGDIMKVSFRVAAAVMAVASLSACATITRGSKQKFEITSEPSAAQVVTTLGDKCVTPCNLNWHSSNRSAASSGAAVSPGGMKAITLPKRRRVPDWILPN